MLRIRREISSTYDLKDRQHDRQAYLFQSRLFRFRVELLKLASLLSNCEAIPFVGLHHYAFGIDELAMVP